MKFTCGNCGKRYSISDKKVTDGRLRDRPYVDGLLGELSRLNVCGLRQFAASTLTNIPAVKD